MVEISRLGLEGLIELRPERHRDIRGFFSEVWSRSALEAVGLHIDFVQDNHSYSAARGVLRGLHLQRPPKAQDKLVRVSRGAIFDVAVDLRTGSPTFGRWEGIVLSAELWNQLLVPKGFAHGFLTLTEDVEVQYKVSGPYSPQLEQSIRYDDPQIGIDWPDIGVQFTVSAKDRSAPLLHEIERGF
jgi:dTDP-4-dehydrorhamnose 3,5-epimerase